MKKLDLHKLHSLLHMNIGGVKKVDILLFTKNLSVVLRSGLTITEGLDIMISQTQGKMRKTLIQILASIRSGKSFCESLADFPKMFSPFYINMIKTGELSGNLEDNLKRLAKHLEKTERLKKKVKGAMIYPGFILTAIAGIGIAIATFVLPKILPLFENLNVDLPPTTKALVFIAKLFENHGVYIIAGTILAGLLTGWLVRQSFIKPVLHRAFLTVPTLKNIIKSINIQRFASTMSILLKSGMTVDESLRIMSNAIDNRVYCRVISSFIPQIESGRSIESVMTEHPVLFPPLISRMVGVGEMTGSLEDTLEYIGDYYEETVDDTIKNISTIIEPVILVIVGLMVGLVAMAIIGPMGQLTGSV